MLASRGPAAHAPLDTVAEVDLILLSFYFFEYPGIKRVQAIEERFGLLVGEHHEELKRLCGPSARRMDQVIGNLRPPFVQALLAGDEWSKDSLMQLAREHLDKASPVK